MENDEISEASIAGYEHIYQDLVDLYNDIYDKNQILTNENKILKEQIEQLKTLMNFEHKK